MLYGLQRVMYVYIYYLFRHAHTVHVTLTVHSSHRHKLVSAMDLMEVFLQLEKWLVLVGLLVRLMEAIRREKGGLTLYILSLASDGILSC